MIEFNWIHVFLFLVPALQFQATTGLDSYVTVRDGDVYVVLPCRNLRKDQYPCNRTDWLFSQSPSSKVDKVVAQGKINGDKSNQLNLTSNCSLVIKKITINDYGRYTCGQYNESHKEHLDARVDLSVINMYQQTTGTLICSVLRYEDCSHTVTLLNEGNRPYSTKQESPCSASVPFNSLQKYTCEVTERNSSDVLLCSFDPPSPCEKRHPDESIGKFGSPVNQEEKRQETIENPSYLPHWWMYIVAALGFSALLILAGVVVGRRRNKGNRTRTEDGTGQSLNPAETQSGVNGSQDTVDFEVPYATISFRKRNNGDAQACDDDDDDDDDGDQVEEEEEEEDQNNVHGDDAVTYSCVAVPQKDSADLSGLYATVKKKKKEEVEEESLQ